MIANLPYDEKDLILRISKGDEQAFTMIFHHYQRKLYGVALDLTHSKSLAEELVQEVFLKVWLKRAALFSVESFSGYLFIIMRNQAYDWLLKQSRQQKILRQISLDHSPQYVISNDFLREKEVALLVNQSLEQLPAQQKEVFRMMRQEGMSREQTALALGIHPNTVKTHMTRALKSLRSWCIRYGDLSVVSYIIFKLLYF